MNVENNQRYRDTEERIQKAYWNLVNHAGGHKNNRCGCMQRSGCSQNNILRTFFRYL